MLNLRHLLSFLSNYRELNAISVLLKPNNAKVGVVFTYCIVELLKHLNKSASENILLLVPLCKVLQDIQSKPPYVEIKFEKENYFYFDSEAFRYLVAKRKPNNVVFDSSAHDDFEKSWQQWLSVIASLSELFCEYTKISTFNKLLYFTDVFLI